MFFVLKELTQLSEKKKIHWEHERLKETLRSNVVYEMYQRRK